MSNPRADLLKIFQAALAAVHGGTCVERFLAGRHLSSTVHAVAVGKAAGAMLEGANAALQGRLRAALLITKPGYMTPGCERLAAVTMLEAGHPLPDERSLQAGRALLDFIAAAPGDAQLLFLISGGASSLVEVLPPGVGLAELRRVNRWLLGSGWDIHRMNVIRKRLSCIKGGRLSAHLNGRKAIQLLISDVPGDRAEDIGSGLLMADEDSHIDSSPLPPWLQTLLKSPAPTADMSRFNDIETHIIASLDQALNAAVREAKELGYAVQVHSERLSGDAAAAGRRLAAELLDGPAGVHIWGGETTVELPAQPGRGGRNQHLALAAAEVLAGHDKVWLLAAGTDGSDGPGEDAGAVVDGGTLARGASAGLEAAECLRTADAGSFLEESGDLLNTGSTGTNVMDVVIGLKV
jgi:hydroxypyruvate reductase